MSETVIERLGTFVQRLSYETLPGAVIEKAQTCLVNGLGIAMASRDTEVARIARDTIKTAELGMPQDKSARIFCDGSKVSVMGAAFANAGLLHARAQDDTVGSSHAGAVITPAVLAVAEREGNSGKDAITALVAGYEVVGAFDREVSAYTTPRGFRASSAFGTFGSAAAVSKLFRLSKEETINALGFAAAFAGGTLECFSEGTMEWRFEVGVASRDGILASCIAKNGGKAAPTAIEGRHGYLNAFANTVHMAPRIVATLGNAYEIMNAGFKPYPICAFNQTPVTAMLDLIRDEQIDVTDAVGIQIRVNPYEHAYAGMSYRGPFRTLGATLMSTPFCLATACVNRELTLDGIGHFDDPRILALIDRIEHIPDAQVPRLSCVLAVTMKDGRTLHKKMVVTQEHYNFKLKQTIDLVKRVTAETGVNQAHVEHMVKLIEDLPEARDVRPLIEVCVLAGSDRATPGTDTRPRANQSGHGQSNMVT